MTISTRSVALATALAVALSTGAVGATAAYAEDAPQGGLISNIDFSAKGSVSVHKRDLGDATPVDPSGNPDPAAPGSALAGAQFTLFPVTNADLGSNAGFAAARAITPQSAVLGTGTSVTTGTDGLAYFGNLPVGLYLLRETVAPAGYTPAADALVWVPMTNPDDRTQWNYAVHVYPKNSLNQVTKEVEDAGKNVGDTITYTITSDIPGLAAAETVISKYEVHDDLDEARLGSPAVTVGLSNNTTFDAGTDYTLSIDPTTLAVKVDFTPAGLQKLTDAKKADNSVKVVTTLTAELLAIGDTEVLVNDASTITNNGGGGGDTITDSNDVETYHGKLQVLKHAAGDEEKLLAGASFQLYVCSDQDTLIGDPLSIGGQDTWTTDNNGTLTINAIQVTDFRDGKEITPENDYCLVETEAPAGYELLPEPIQFNFTRADLDQTATLLKKVENVETVRTELPLTGGTGIGLLAALGALIVGAGAWIARRMNRA